MNQAGPNPRHFVRGDRSSNPASTDGQAALHLSTRNRARERHDKIRIIIVGRRLAVAKVNDFETSPA